MGALQMKELRCCLCESEMTSKDEIVETRPTGAYGGTQDWHYCFECWISMEQVRQWDLDLELLFKTVFTGLEEKETALPWLGNSHATEIRPTAH